MIKLCRLGAGLAAAVAGPWLWAAAALAEAAYNPIRPTAETETITLTGHDLTIDQVVEIARGGAKVTLSPEARTRSADAYGLLLEAATEGVAVYWFNRGSGDQREVAIFSGDPLSPENKAKIAAQQRLIFTRGEAQSYGTEIADEDIVRAMMAIRVNTMSYEAASPPLTQMLIDLLNNRITPVVRSRGTVGEGDLALMGNIGAAMVGVGDVYYKGVRMPAAEALRRANLAPLQPFGADEAALVSTDAYAEAQTALLLADARDALDWADLAYAMDLDGMNSSVAPLSMPVQTNRPFPWLNFDAARVLEMTRGGYLFQDDANRIIQDPESMRASTQRQGSAWEAWAALWRDELISINSSDHNPAVRPGISPSDSWELSTPQMMKFYVKGGYIFSNANWDPYPLANDVEAFTIALANMDVVVMLRMERFENPFFTILKPTDLLTREQAYAARGDAGGYLPVDIWQEIQGLEMPVPPEGQAIVATVEDLQGQTRLKVDRARVAVDDTFHLLAMDLQTGALWMDLRRMQSPTRRFGQAPAAAQAALRQVQPLEQDAAARTAGKPVIYDFIKARPARSFFPAGIPAPPSPSPGSIQDARAIFGVSPPGAPSTQPPKPR